METISIGEAAIGVMIFALNAGFVGQLQEPDIDESLFFEANTLRGDMMSPYLFIGEWYLLHL